MHCFLFIALFFPYFFLSKGYRFIRHTSNSSLSLPQTYNQQGIFYCCLLRSYWWRPLKCQANNTIAA